MRVIAVASNSVEGQSIPIPNQIIDRFLTERGLSLAYTTSERAAVVSLNDVPYRFRDLSNASLQARINRDAPAMIVSESMARQVDFSASGNSHLDTVGTFTPQVQFEGSYPLAFINDSATTYGSGIYFFAGTDGITNEEVLQWLENQHMTIVSATADEGVTVTSVLRSAYGAVAVGFLSIAAVLWLATVLIYAWMSTPWLNALVLTGASSRDIFWALLKRLLRHAGIGAALGLAMLTVLLYLSAPYLVSSLSSTAFQGLLAAGCATILILAMSMLAATIGTLRSRHDPTA